MALGASDELMAVCYVYIIIYIILLLYTTIIIIIIVFFLISCEVTFALLLRHTTHNLHRSKGRGHVKLPRPTWNRARMAPKTRSNRSVLMTFRLVLG